MKNKIKDLILRSRFLEAEKEIAFLGEKDLEDILHEIAFDERSICAYTFLAFLIREHEALEWHLFASHLLNIAFCQLEGAYERSLYHIRRAIELRPDDITLKESLLFFNDIPEKVLSDKKAINIAREILHINPASGLAARILSKRLAQNKNTEGSKGNGHKWEKVAPKTDWKDIKKIIKDVIQTGEYQAYNGRDHSKIKEINGNIVRVTYAVAPDGTLKIGSSWVE
jgi:tetratricopeptide (TPR) repeat protein